MPKKEVRVWLDHDTHAALLAICDTTEGLRPGEWSADVLTEIIRKRVLDANVVVTQLTASGSMRTFTEGAEKSLEVKGG